jgi:multidrug efflux pump subunit AcrB
MRLLVVRFGFGVFYGMATLVQSGVIRQEYLLLENVKQLSLSLRTAPGATLEATDRVGQQVEATLMDRNRFPDIKSVFTSLSADGRAINIAWDGG